ncbi:MAG: hypothetical protein EOP48_20420 [Sphingobacteriales bacterium]|nr:MAG: hypothetical protein EOP48_20420 [Sphingobacteriales bacterium]
MFPAYEWSVNQDNSYKFTTHDGRNYKCLFTECQIKDRNDDTHVAYSFTFDKQGAFSFEGFMHKHDSRIKFTIFKIIEHVFNKFESCAVLYHCFPGDQYARQRSITFSMWAKEAPDTYALYKKTLNSEDGVLYCGVIVMENNPLKDLLVEASEPFFSDVIGKDL